MPGDARPDSARKKPANPARGVRFFNSRDIRMQLFFIRLSLNCKDKRKPLKHQLAVPDICPSGHVLGTAALQLWPLGSWLGSARGKRGGDGRRRASRGQGLFHGLPAGSSRALRVT